MSRKAREAGLVLLAWIEKSLDKTPLPTMTVKSNRMGTHIGRHVDKQGPRMPVRSSAGCDKYARKSTLNILQLNIQGLQHKTLDSEKRLSDEQIHVVLLQETLLPEEEKV